MIRSCDVVVIGGGPFGLTAARVMASSGLDVMVIEASAFGGRPLFLEWLDNFPYPGDRMDGPTLASRLVDEAEAAGARLESGRVESLELYSQRRACLLADGGVVVARAAVIAVGRADRKLGIEGETAFAGRGLIQCALCDGALYRDRPVVVCGGGDAGATEALHLARFGARVTLLEQDATLSCSPEHVQRLRLEPRISVLTEAAATALEGDSVLRSVAVKARGSTEPVALAADGFIARVGYAIELPAFAPPVAIDLHGWPRGTGVAGRPPGLYGGGDAAPFGERSIGAAIAQGKATARSVLDHIDDVDR